MLVRMVFASGSSPGSIRASEPVAMITFFASTVWTLSPVRTSTGSIPLVPRGRMVPYPLIQSILFFFIKNSTPLACLATILFLRSSTFA